MAWEDSDLLVLFTITLCVFSCPFTKVEESFNMQAISDLYQFGIFRLDMYDHLEFPGVVPRTFIGALAVRVLSTPFVSLVNILNLEHSLVQTVARLTVGFMSWMSLLSFKSGVSQCFGKRAAQLLIVLTALQFHTCFYMSRTLPNTFALMFCQVSFGYWLRV